MTTLGQIMCLAVIVGVLVFTYRMGHNDGEKEFREKIREPFYKKTEKLFLVFSFCENLDYFFQALSIKEDGNIPEHTKEFYLLNSGARIWENIEILHSQYKSMLKETTGGSKDSLKERANLLDELSRSANYP